MQQKILIKVKIVHFRAALLGKNDIWTFKQSPWITSNKEKQEKTRKQRPYKNLSTVQLIHILCINLGMYTNIHIHIHDIHIHIYIYIFTYIHIYIHKHTYIHTYTYIYTYTLAYIPKFKALIIR